MRTALEYCTCMLCEHSQDTYSTYTWLKKTWKCALRLYYNNLYSLRFTPLQYWTYYGTDMSLHEWNPLLLTYQVKLVSFCGTQLTQCSKIRIQCHHGESYNTYRGRLGSHQWRASCDREKDSSDLDIQLPLKAINAELPSSGSNKWSHSISTMDKVGYV